MTPSGLPEDEQLSLHEAMSAFKRTFVRAVLAANNGNRSRAAAALKIERTSLLRLIRVLRISEANVQRGRPPAHEKRVREVTLIVPTRKR